MRHCLGQTVNPQFEGQTKAKLGNTSMRSLVERATNEKLAEWLEENPTEGRQIVLKAIQASRPGWPPEMRERRPGASPRSKARACRKTYGLPHSGRS